MGICGIRVPVLRGKPAIRSQNYLIPQGHPLKDAVEFSYTWSFKKGGQLLSGESSSGSDGEGTGKWTRIVLAPPLVLQNEGGP